MILRVFKLDIKEIKKLIEIVEQSDISEIEINEGDVGVRISRVANNASMPPPMAAPLAQALAQPAVMPVAEPAPSLANAFKSPMVGTFYRASSPTSSPFVSVGDSVSVGSTLCIIEAMKIMNQIEAETLGTVKEILVEDGQPVEFGQPLFVIE